MKKGTSTSSLMQVDQVRSRYGEGRELVQNLVIGSREYIDNWDISDLFVNSEIHSYEFKSIEDLERKLRDLDGDKIVQQISNDFGERFKSIRFLFISNAYDLSHLFYCLSNYFKNVQELHIFNSKIFKHINPIIITFPALKKLNVMKLQSPDLDASKADKCIIQLNAPNLTSYSETNSECTWDILKLQTKDQVKNLELRCQSERRYLANMYKFAIGFANLEYLMFNSFSFETRESISRFQKLGGWGFANMDKRINLAAMFKLFQDLDCYFLGVNSKAIPDDYKKRDPDDLMADASRDFHFKDYSDLSSRLHFMTEINYKHMEIYQDQLPYEFTKRFNNINKIYVRLIKRPSLLADLILNCPHLTLLHIRFSNLEENFFDYLDLPINLKDISIKNNYNYKKFFGSNMLINVPINFNFALKLKNLRSFFIDTQLDRQFLEELIYGTDLRTAEFGFNNLECFLVRDNTIIASYCEKNVYEKKFPNRQSIDLSEVERFDTYNWYKNKSNLS